MNHDVLRQIKDINIQCAKELEKDFRMFKVDTSFGETKDDPKRTAENIAETILDLLEEQINENILSCSREAVTNLFKFNNFISGRRAEELIQHFCHDDDSDFRPRETVESDASRIQALPIVVIRNASGEVLRLRRRERHADSPLHDKLVIWAGGHVRSEDAVNGNPIIHCAARELEEELRLQVEPSSLKLVGAVYIDNGGGTSKHVGIAYEWHAETDDVSVVLSKSEFFERRGTSLSGSFASVEELSEDIKKNGAGNHLKEPWSVELIRGYLAKNAFDPGLFD